jgi:hypothetical protein
MPAIASDKANMGPEGAAIWGDLRLDFAAFPPHNLAPMLKGAPDDRCQCPHWGYLFKGKILVRYADHEETIEAGQAFYMPPGHVPEALEACEVVQFSPPAELREVIAIMERNARALAPDAGAPATRGDVAEIARQNS